MVMYRFQAIYCNIHNIILKHLNNNYFHVYFVLYISSFGMFNFLIHNNTNLVFFKRYMTYIGLLVSAGVILPMSKSMGSIFGGLVLSYMIGAEYYCMINGLQGLVNLKQFDLMQLFYV